MHLNLIPLSACILLTVETSLSADEPRGRFIPSGSVTSILDIPYASDRNPRQRLDIFLPAKPKSKGKLPLVVFIHGGGWQKGSKRAGHRLLQSLVSSGKFAGASIGYRLSGEAIWPAQIHDCKAAIRWLRANAKAHGIDPEHIGVTGTSAGGHLASMLGTSGDVATLNGTLGIHTDESSRVQCVVSQFGPTDFLALRNFRDVSKSAEARLIGAAVEESNESSRTASPIHYVSADDPPFLFLHGTEDKLVPLDQSSRLNQALKRLGVQSTLVSFDGAGHGNLPRAAVANKLREFFIKHLHPH